MSADAFTRQIEAAHQRLLDLEQRASGSTDQPSVTIEALEELSTAMEELHVAAEELRQQNEELVAARYIAEAERQRYQELFEFAPDGYLVTDPEGIIREANRAASALLGVRQDFLIGKPLLVFVTEQDQQAFHTRLTQLHTTDVISRDLPRLEIMLQPRDGEPFPVSLTVGLVHDAESQLAGLRWLLRDITERVRAGKELGWLASFPKLNPNPVIEMDLSGHVGYLNPAAKRLFPDLIAGSQHPWLAGLEGLAERFRTETLSSTQREITLGEACYEQTLHYVAEQQRIRIYGLDISERKRMEEALRQSNIELQARNEALDTFAQTVAHDLKNLLSIILGYAEELTARDASLRADERLAYLQNIASGARKLNIITDELMIIAEVHNLEAMTEPLHMATIVDEARQRLTKLIETYQAEINLREPSAWPIAVGYDSWIEEVWVNYLSNALKYGGRPPRIELGAQPQANGLVRFWIHDNGSGLTPADQTRLFTPFTRLNRARGIGHGLGLSIVRRIVEKLGGQVGVESQPGQGSTFFFTLPAAGYQHQA